METDMKKTFFYAQRYDPCESDLACERRRANASVAGISYKCERCPSGSWERICISSEEGSKSIGRPIGNYDTLNTGRLDLLDLDGADDAKNEVAAELCRLFDKNGISPERILVVGLGNKALTPDAVGPMTAELVEPTMHISRCDRKMFESLECSEIAVIAPGVCASSGLDSSAVTVGVCEKIKPDAVIAVDALASRSPDRLGTTLQICDTGIFPGTGLGYGTEAIDRDLLGVPVIAIGVPTVINSNAFGSNSAGMFVAPKDINGIVESASRIIAGGINQAFGLDF